MGMYDTIYFKCPICGSDLEAQTKSGDCVLNSYEMHAVPLDAAQGANRHAPFECDCGKKWVFKIPEYKPPEKIELKLVELK